MLLLWAGYSEQWELNHKVTFDGAAKRIYISPNISILDVKVDIYSSWKEWLQLYDNSKFFPAFRTVGGDPTSGGRYAGDLYFLINGWQIVIDHFVELNGVIYHDDGISPFVVEPGGGVVSTVSNLVQSLGFSGTVNNVVEPNIMPKDVWDYLVAEANTPGSVGERFSSLLTIAKYMGLK